MARGYFQSAGLNAGESLGVIHATLSADAWVGDSTAGYSQTVVAIGVTADPECCPHVQLEHLSNTSKSAWEAQCDAYADFCASGWTETGDSVITFYTYEAPTVDINIIICGYDCVDDSAVTETGGTNLTSTMTMNSAYSYTDWGCRLYKRGGYYWLFLNITWSSAPVDVSYPQIIRINEPYMITAGNQFDINWNAVSNLGVPVHIGLTGDGWIRVQGFTSSNFTANDGLRGTFMIPDCIPAN